MRRNGMWLPIITSLGVGAATYYTMSKNNQTFGQTIQKIVPFVTQMTNSTSSNNTEHMGQDGLS